MLLNCGIGKHLQFPSTARRSNQSILKEFSPEYSLEGLMLQLKLQYFDHLMGRTDSLEKTLCWERLKARGEGDDRGWDGWMASPTWWTWVWVRSRSWWWIGRPGVLQSMGSQRVRHDWVTELNGVYHCHFLYSGVFSCLKFDKSWNRVYLHYLNSWRQLGEYPKIIIKLTTIRKWKRK